MPSKKILYPWLQFASDCSLLATFGNTISRKHHLDVLRLFSLLRSENHPAVWNLHPAYSSLLISFNPLLMSPGDLEVHVRELLDRIDSAVIPPTHTVVIPVCYDPALAPDLEFVASHNDVSIAQAIHYHSSAEYVVYFLGFSPGFPYLGELPRQLATPRLSTPRLAVPAGSVAIGGSQTGIYPTVSPGGWRIIGRTPLRLFRPELDEPTLLRMGDIVRFKPIAREVFDQMTLQMAGGPSND
jgi:inhibitor of KinA